MPQPAEQQRGRALCALAIRSNASRRIASSGAARAPRDELEKAEVQRKIPEEAYAGTLSTYYTHLDDALFARAHFIIRTTRGNVPPVDIPTLEATLAEAGRLWIDRVEAAAEEAFGEGEAHERLSRLQAFPVDYQARTSPEQAIADLVPIEKVLDGSPLEAALHPRAGEATPGLRLYRQGGPVVLSDILPILENLGLRIIAEELHTRSTAFSAHRSSGCTKSHFGRRCGVAGSAHPGCAAQFRGGVGSDRRWRGFENYRG